MKRAFVFALILLSTIAVSTASAGPVIRSVTPLKATVPRYELIELTIDLSAKYDNPFDPDDIDLTVTFISPSGARSTVPAFYFQGYERSRSEGLESLEPSGGPAWKVRFTPTEVGKYSYKASLRDRSGEARSAPAFFVSSTSTHDGFVRPAPKGRYCVRDSGKEFFAVGENTAWASKRKGTYDYDRYFENLGLSGANFARVWMVSWALALEWSAGDVNEEGDYSGLGRYSMENAWRLDHVFRVAEAKDLAIMLTLGNYGDLMSEKGFWNEGRWHANPYNAVHGGPCKAPADFWTDELARSAYKKRLRYIVARWGYSTALFAIELWNEMSPSAVWVDEMARFIKENDPNRHMVTISLSKNIPRGYHDEEIWSLPSIDLVQAHLYGQSGGSADGIGELVTRVRFEHARSQKPFLVAEFGIDASKDDKYYDRSGRGVNLHNGLWAASLSGAMGGAMNWWWDTYVQPKALYRHFTGIARFARLITWTREEWSRLEVLLLRYPGAQQGTLVCSDVSVSTVDAWKKTEEPLYTMTEAGDLLGGEVNKYLHGTSKPDMRTTPEFTVTYPVDGKFSVTIGTVSQGGDLSIIVDGKCLLRIPLPSGPLVPGKEGRSEYRKQYDIWWCRYDETYTVDIAAGKHTIKLENNGFDWVAIERLDFIKCRDASLPNIRVVGLARTGEAIVWVQNREYNWNTIFMKREPSPVLVPSFKLKGIVPDGAYEARWYSTETASEVRHDEVVCAEGTITLSFSELVSDLACIVRKK